MKRLVRQTRPVATLRLSLATSLVLAPILLGIGMAAHARTPMYTLVGVVDQRESDDTSHLVAFDTGTRLEFRTFSEGRVAIYFSAECSVSAGDETTWLDVDLKLDGNTLTPTDDDNAFCSSRGISSPAISP